MSSILEALDNAKKNTHKRKSQVDDWLLVNENKREDLINALRWYTENKSNKFGWRAFYDTLKSQKGWEELPGTYQCLKSWAQANVPEIF